MGQQENSHGAFQDLARIFSSQFADVDLVASDIAVGLMIVSQQQHLAAQKRTDLHQVSRKYFYIALNSLKMFTMLLIRCRSDPYQIITFRKYTCACSLETESIYSKD